MQEFIVFAIALGAVIYLFAKFIAKKKSHNCTKCDANENEKKQH